MELVFIANMHGLFLWKAKNALQLLMLFKSNCKPNKTGVDKGSEFCNWSLESWLQDNNIEMHSTHNEGKSVTTERFVRNLKNKTYKYQKIWILTN